MVSGGEDGVIRIWQRNRNQTKAKNVLNGHIGDVYTCEFSPCGNFVVSGGNDKTAKLWDLEKFKEIQTFSEHKGTLFKVKFHPDSFLFGSCSHDKTIKIYDIRTQRLV